MVRPKPAATRRRTEFLVGSLADTGLPPQSFDAAVSLDALWLAADQQQALTEVARILRSGAKFVFPSWEQHLPMPFVKNPVADYRPMLWRAGFVIELYEYLPHSAALMLVIYERIRNSQQTLREEMGEAVQGLLKEAYFVPGLVDGVNYLAQENGPHVLVCATRV